MRLKAPTLRSEQGAIFVQLGISLFVVMAFNVFVLDYGMMWIGRRQAQNAADAGALAGAVARGYDDFDFSNGLAHDSAQQVALANMIWQQAGTAVATPDCPAGVTGRCVRVEVYRDGTNGSTALPTLFGPVLGFTSQKVKASATAIADNANATDCLRPIAFADQWSELHAPINNEFNGYDEVTGLPLADKDTYTAPSATQTGQTTVSVDLGERIIWNLDQPTTSTTTPITRGLAVALTLPGAGTYQSKVENCSGESVQLGQTLPVEVPAGNPMFQAFNTLMGQDPGVTWNESQHRIDNSCAPGCAQVSPRLIPVALFNPDRFQLGRATNDWTQPGVGCPTNSPCITVTNIVGFFVHGAFGGYGPHGHFLKFPGRISLTAPTFVDEASWLVTTHLIR
jgi:Putative Flp pilus-assembly TadE/G-like